MEVESRQARRGPDFLVIGCQKCGTTSLYRYLVRHPDVLPARDKQLHFFDRDYSPDLEGYEEQFPERSPGSSAVTGEATPYYVFHPACAERVAKAYPRVKLILLMRDPVARAWSHYRHEVSKSNESLPFEEAVSAEESRLAGEAERLVCEPGYSSYNHIKFSYLARGRYAEQLESWMNAFSRQSFLFLSSEDLFEKPAETMDEVFGFLGFAPHESASYPAHNTNEYRPAMPRQASRALASYFAPHNERLFTMIGRRFNWSGEAA